MKQKILICLALFLGSVSMALGQRQDYITLNSPLKVTKDSAIVACKEITLNPTFEFTAVAGRGLELNIDPSCASVENGCITISTKDATGALIKNGIFKVTKSNGEQVGGNYITANGSVNIIDLKYGTYTVSQITTPYGYELTSASSVSVTITDNNCKSAVFTYRKLPEVQKVDLQFDMSYRNMDSGVVVNSDTVKYTYEGVRIGEYYWMNRNFSHPIGHLNWEYYQDGTYLRDIPVTQEMIDRIMDIYKLNTSYYRIKDDKDFLKYFGNYYQREALEYMVGMKMSEKVNGKWVGSNNQEDPNRWKLPFPEDFRQLFAMTPFVQQSCGTMVLNEAQIRHNLGAELGSNPFAIFIPDTSPGQQPVHDFNWFTAGGNIYGFNMMPSGQRSITANDPWFSGMLDGNGVLIEHKTVEPGDFIQLFQTVYYPTDAANTFRQAEVITSYGKEAEKSWKRLPIRWSRRLSDSELGYKLYIKTDNASIRNSQAWTDLTTPNWSAKSGYQMPYDITLLRKLRTGEFSIKDFDIIKKDLYELAPANSVELPKGYIRGLYVQYILNNPNPKSVQEILVYAYNIHDNQICPEMGINTQCPCVVNELPAKSNEVLDTSED